MNSKLLVSMALAVSLVDLIATIPNIAKAQVEQPANALGQFSDASLKRLLDAISVSPEQDTSSTSIPRLVMSDRSAVNTGHNKGLAPTYLGLPTFHDHGAMRLDTAHVTLTGYTRGWEASTCVLAVVANVPEGTSTCTQGGFWDANYRSVYPGQDSAAAFFGINGITPVARDTLVADFSTKTLTNPGGEVQLVGLIKLQTPLSTSQIHALNEAASPVRVQTNNGYFAYVLPSGFTSGGVTVDPAAADGRTIFVDNWVRAIQPNNSAPADTPGGTATRPSLPYWTPTGIATGTGILPDRVGLTNGSPPLSQYRVTIDGNLLADAQYGGFKISNDDIVNAARYIEIVGVNNKTGTPTWNELQPTDDQLDGQPLQTHLIFGGCQNDDSQGLGICGALLVGSIGLKRVVVCSNPQSTVPEGATDCVLDTSSTIGWKSTKKSGYVLWIDPDALGHPQTIIDWDGNINSRKRLFIGDGTTGVTLSPNGDEIATGAITSQGNITTQALFVPGSYKLAEVPACSTNDLGAHVFVSDGLKPRERPGQGSGVPADCVPPRMGTPAIWVSVYSHTKVER